MYKIGAFLSRNSRLIILIISLILPFALLPLAFSPLKELKCAYVIGIVTGYWLLEPVPIAATALLPVVLFPILGVSNSSDVAVCYMNEAFMMFIGGLIVAVAVENCMLHERIALKVLLLIGSEIRWLMLGFMLTTMFLSMWISNTATTAMMVPIVEAIIEEMTMSNVDGAEISLTEINGDIPMEIKENKIEDGLGPKIKSSKRKIPIRNSGLKTTFLLCICYSANIGGTGTLTGTGPNLVLKGYLEDTFPDSDEITFATWTMYNVPGMVLCVLIGWFYLYMMHVRCSTRPLDSGSKDGVKEIITKRYKKLGPIKFHEASVIVLFLMLVLLWIFRDPKVIQGWSSAIQSDTKIGDSVSAIAVCFLLFLLPSDPWHFRSSPPILEWKTAQSKLPWGVIILCGGGFALADASKRSGLSLLLGNELTSLSVLPAGVIVVIISFMTAIFTEVMTNTTTATILLPVIGQMAISIGVNPLFLLLPVTVTCSYAFMLPVATAPNAIAFESGQMRTLDMAKPGLAMNLVCCLMQLLMINTLGFKMFNLNEFPSWANTTGTYTQFTNNYTGISDNVQYVVNNSLICANQTNMFLL